MAIDLQDGEFCHQKVTGGVFHFVRGVLLMSGESGEWLFLYRVSQNRYQKNFNSDFFITLIQILQTALKLCAEKLSTTLAVTIDPFENKIYTRG